MRRLLSFFILSLLSLQTAIAAPTFSPKPPSVSARGYLLMDTQSGQILAEKNSQQRMAPASLTKLMTLYITFQALKSEQIHPDDLVTISKKAWKTGGSRMFLKIGSHVSVKDIIRGIATASGNDASVAIAEHIAGDEETFATFMNQTAAQLGMKDTHFSDATGLPKPDHYTTPHDLAILSIALINHFPEYYELFKEKWINYNGIRQPNRNRLLWRDPSVDGLKTGHTDSAGYCLIASAKRHGMRLLSVVMGTDSDKARNDNSAILLNWGFRYYDTYKLYSANQPILTPRIWFGNNKQTALGLKKDLFLTIPKGQYKKLHANTQVTPLLKAPLKKNDAYGKLVVSLNETIIAQNELVALENNEEAGFWSRLFDHIALLWHSWFGGSSHA